VSDLLDGIAALSRKNAAALKKAVEENKGGGAGVN